MTELDVEKIADLISKKLTLSPRWLKLVAAAQYSAMNKHRLTKLAINGDIIGYQDAERGDWVFDKESIDEYRLRPVQQIKKKKNAILKSLT